MVSNFIKFILVVICIFFSLASFSQEKTEIKLKENEKWWAGIIDKGFLMPLKNGFSFNMLNDNNYNQLQPLFISNKGRFLFSEEPLKFTLKDGVIEIEGKEKLIINIAGSTLKEAYKAAAKKHFAFNGKYPDSMLFVKPQYNTWIELNYHQNQKDILNYAQIMLDNGLPPGVLMIDDTWQHDYGVWDFDANQFPNAKLMMDSLHKKGFKLMLWTCPFVSPDSREYRELAKQGGLLMNLDGKKPKMVEWWNGVSAVIDLSHPNGVKWFKKQLDFLQTEYGVDGFKFDAGDSYFYKDGKSYGNVSPFQQTLLFNKIGEEYALNEYRAAWKVGGAPLAQRLSDKRHSWADLQKLIPDITLQGLMGYSFACPDMIGGGAIFSLIDGAKIDQELIVRSAQCHVFMPMMQFSVNPFRILNQENQGLIKDAVALRQKFVSVIMDLVKYAAKTGEPVVRMMDYEFPNEGFDSITDQFMLGSNYLIAPVLEKSANMKKVRLPKGNWKDAAGKKYKGGVVIDFPVKLETLPYFEKIN